MLGSLMLVRAHERGRGRQANTRVRRHGDTGACLSACENMAADNNTFGQPNDTDKAAEERMHAHVGARAEHDLTERAERVLHALRLRQALRELRENARRDRNVNLLDGDARRAGEAAHDRQQRVPARARVRMRGASGWRGR